MTSRQKEFCRHYLAGKPAKEAALAAGYAIGVADSNASHILSSPQVQAYLTYRRRRAALFCFADIEKARESLLKTLSDPSPRIAIQGLRQFQNLAKAFPQLFDTWAEDVEIIPPPLDKNPAQEADNQTNQNSLFCQDPNQIHLSEMGPFGPIVP